MSADMFDWDELDYISSRPEMPYQPREDGWYEPRRFYGLGCLCDDPGCLCSAFTSRLEPRVWGDQ